MALVTTPTPPAPYPPPARSPLAAMGEAFAAFMGKAASLLMPGGHRQGYWRGDPIGSGEWVSGPTWGTWRGNGSINYRAAARDIDHGLDSSIVWACLRAICDAVQEPPIRLWLPDEDGELQKQPDSAPIIRLLRRPNPAMRWKQLVRLIALYEHWMGEAFLWKARNGSGRPVQLWPLKPWQVTPVGGESTADWITHYLYRPDDREDPIRLPVADVMHFKLDLDPHDPRRGRSPLRAVLSSLFTDEEAREYANAMLHNFGIPGPILTPKPGMGGSPTQAQADAIKEVYKQKFTGANRGEPTVMTAPYDIHTVAFNPQQLLVDKAHLLPESRVCADLGVPPIVALLQVGLENATYENAEKMYSAFIETKMVPYWSLLDDELSDGLLPDFYGEDTAYVLKHDLTEVRALQEDDNEIAERLKGLAAAGLMTVNQVQQKLGYAGFGKDGDVLLLPNTVTPTKPEDLLTAAEEAMQPPEPPPALLPSPGAVDQNQGRAQVREVPRPAGQEQGQGPTQPPRQERTPARNRGAA